MDVQQAIINKLMEEFPEINNLYMEDYVPQEFSAPAFFVSLIKQRYTKRLNNKYKGTLSFDVTYFSNQSAASIKSDYLVKQEALMRAFDIFDTYRAINKNAEVVDNVLHFTFDVNYSEMIVETGTKMQTQTTTTNI
jgi:hypothetical protein